MPRPYSPFLNDRAIAGLRTNYGQAMQTLQNWRDDELLTFTRWDEADGWVTLVADVKPIKIELLNREDRTSSDGLIESITAGTCRCWSGDLPTTLQPEDRFTWQGQPCIVTSHPVDRLETVTFEFSMAVTNQ